MTVHLQGVRPGIALCGCKARYFGGPNVPDFCKRCLAMPGIRKWRMSARRLLRTLGMEREGAKVRRYGR
jgi:hypothetical protein